MSHNIFANIPKNLESEVFEQLINSDNIRIERIISKGHQSPDSDWYDQEQNEWVMIIAGEAILLFEDDKEVTMKKGDYINISAHKKHKVKRTAPKIETIWLAIFY